MTTPLSVVKERFGDKSKLIAEVQKLATSDLWLEHKNHEGLEHVSNAKLLRLHDALSSAKAEFGSRDKLIGAILDIEKRTKDEGYKTRLAGYSLPRLLDTHRAAKKRGGAPKPPASSQMTKKPARSKKAKAKATK